ncbi:MAG: DNA polymerase III subunit delta' [Aquamicrobium sp.]|uniref:DNA polymerase III subunit delta' n=1 Tax=Aquamicrobium sp. TaxID=1872579 RepID=UPI00349E69AB|nr:DNA polymerase III subunit delta' [Aquamicrobium sp.]
MSFTRLAPEQFDTIPDIAEPAENPFLAGHDEAGAHVAAAYRAGRLHHALLLAGPSGIGKATFAFHLAEHLLRYPHAGEAPEGLAPRDPDLPLFRQIAQGAHPSVLHLTRPLNEKTKAFKSAVTVDEIRRIGRFLSMTSHDGSWRVVIVDPADDMNANAANALLKNLEEPPPRTQFVLIAHSPGGLLPTIRSRCHLVRLKPLETPALISVLERLEADVPETEAGRAALAARAGGSVREALLLTRYGGLDIAEAISRILGERAFPVAEAWRAAEAVGGRDATVQFSIFNQSALDSVSGWARHAGETGDLAGAARLSELWREMERLTVETETYNLDKRQHAMGLLRRMWQAAKA